ncbi:1-phosphofructokinase [Halanaerobium salsuginis]|uniref:Tagatose-6-phosphate kinase n=1 Tax=Halanaerobium salsuginis TaxID=29563 RepID=A0A1I4GSX0_9FIRM|nr:1-phosphofructokinase [Halanaerobium salsuginis]SFL33138.1 6-phosphofructokinase 2 [Halanaerobium salsuginis]
MIYTLTTNPAIDMNIESNKIRPGVVNRTKSTSYSENGKGVNVSLILKHFNVQSTVLGFFGGFSGKFILDELAAKDIPNKAVLVEEATRINIFLNDGKDEYKIVNKGSFVSRKKQLEFLDLLNNLDDCQYLVISGSLPKGIKESYYNEILEICQKNRIEVILDISSSKLKDLLNYQPLLIKPNDDEVNQIFSLATSTEAEIKASLQEIHKLGARNILLTMGEKGLYFSNRKKIYYCNAPEIELCSSACAGDSALAAFLSEWIYQPDNLELALKQASATGANVAESAGRGELKKVEEYLEVLQIKEVK